ncbi:MAG: c-type cytochrome biogenesis protein CcmI [Nitrosomonadaceae bacterium]|nr:c-type cytochrome biogenesis protein CcmI [Nitrosomonadaceae bacterium]
MTLFWVLAGVFIIGALLFILPTLLRKNNNLTGIENRIANVRIYQDQVSELDHDLRNDTLNQNQYNQSKLELQQRMLQDIPEENATKDLQITGNRGIATSAIIFLVMPILAISLYLLLGNTKALSPQPVNENTQASNQSSVETDASHRDQEISSMVNNLTQRLKNQPDDIEGWLMLGRTYSIMGRFKEASDVYAKLLILVPNNAEILVDYADVLAMTRDGSLAGESTELINKALLIDSKNPKALALAGTAAFEQDNFKQAANHWEKLLTIIPADSKLAQSVSESITKAKSLASKSLASNGKSESTVKRESKILSENNNALPLKTQRTTANITSASTVSGIVKITPAFAVKISPEDNLYIYARAKEGPKMPLAIVRLRAKDLPASFLLKDGMGMNPNMKLSSFAEVVISARITKTGRAMPESGDLQGFSSIIKMGDQSVSILIDQEVP